MAAIAGVNDEVTFLRNMTDSQLEGHVADVNGLRARYQTLQMRVLMLEDFIRFIGNCKNADEVYDFVVNNYDKARIPEEDIDVLGT